MTKKRTSFNFNDSIVLLVIYFGFAQAIIPILLTVFFPKIGMGVLNFLILGIATLISALWYRHHLVEEFKKFANNASKNITKVLSLYALMMLVNILTNIFLVEVLNIQGNSANQELVEILIGQMPLLMAISTTVFAPILEELVFRGGLYLGLKQRIGGKLATLISSASFGLIHVTSELLSSGNWVEVFLIIPYIVMGYFMLDAVKKTDSLWGGILLHFINNLVATAVVTFF